MAKIDANCKNWRKLIQIAKIERFNFRQFHPISPNLHQFHPILNSFFRKKRGAHFPCKKKCNFSQFSAIYLNLPNFRNFIQLFEFHGISLNFSTSFIYPIFTTFSIFVNFHQFSSIFVNFRRSIYSNFRQFHPIFAIFQIFATSPIFATFSIFFNFPQFSPTFINFHWFFPQNSPISHNFLQFSSIFFNLPQFAPIFINFFQFSSIFLNFSSLSNLIQFEFINFIRSRKWKPNFQNFSKQLFNYDIFNSDVRASIPALTFLISRG